MNAIAEIPPRMAHLDRDRRGYPVSVMAYRDADGRPHFQINEETVRQRIIAEDQCSICGGKLLRGRWFVGGELSAFHPNGSYVDPPMHDECAHYALRVCPYLAAPQYGKYIETATLKPDDPLIGNTVIDPGMIDERPQVFVAVMATGHRKIDGEVRVGPLGVPFVQYLKPRRPYLRVEFWRHGAKITDDEARALLGERIPA